MSWELSKITAQEEEREQNNGYTAEEAEAIASNPEAWARLFGRIPDRVSKQPIPWEPSALQCRMFAEYRRKQKIEKPCRMVVPKTRRGGGSTGAAGIMYCHAHNYPSRLGAVGTDYEVSQNMYKMMSFFDKHDRFPCWPRASKKLDGDGKIEWPNESSWERYTAENPEAARSAGLQGYHGSECGRFPNGGVNDGKETLRSMLGAVPRRGFTVVIEESTAQGAQGAFYDRFKSGRWPEEATWWHKWQDEFPQNVPDTAAEKDQQFVRIFAAWFEDEENAYDQPVTIAEAKWLLSSLDEVEHKLIEKYKTVGPQGERLGEQVTKATLIQQLAWRRAVIKTEFDGDPEAFAQENPSSPMDAFASSGVNTFNQRAVMRMREIAKIRGPVYGVLDPQQSGVTFRRCEKREAWWLQWEEPRIGHRYIIGGDTMSGKSQVKNEDKADYHSFPVLRASFVDDFGIKRPHRLVGRMIACQWDIDILVERVMWASRYYGGCLVVPEVNNTGHAFVLEAKRIGMPLYRRVQTDKHTNEVTEYVGWQTDNKTRHDLFTTLKKHIRNNLSPATEGDGVEVWDMETVDQLASCIRHGDGKDAAPTGQHDDDILGLGLALHNITSATYYSAHHRKKRQPADRAAWTAKKW